MALAMTDRDRRHRMLGLPQVAEAWLMGKGMRGSRQQRRWLQSTAVLGRSVRAPLATGRKGSPPLAAQLSSFCRPLSTAMGELQAFINSLRLFPASCDMESLPQYMPYCLGKLPNACSSSLLALSPELAVMGQGVALFTPWPIACLPLLAST